MSWLDEDSMDDERDERPLHDDLEEEEDGLWDVGDEDEDEEDEDEEEESEQPRGRDPGIEDDISDDEYDPELERDLEDEQLGRVGPDE